MTNQQTKKQSRAGKAIDSDRRMAENDSPMADSCDMNFNNRYQISVGQLHPNNQANYAEEIKQEDEDQSIGPKYVLVDTATGE